MHVFNGSVNDHNIMADSSVEKCLLLKKHLALQCSCPIIVLSKLFRHARSSIVIVVRHFLYQPTML